MCTKFIHFSSVFKPLCRVYKTHILCSLCTMRIIWSFETSLFLTLKDYLTEQFQQAGVFRKICIILPFKR